MAYEYDRFEREDGGGSFLMGLLAGTVLGAGLGMLFAPKAGSELRSQLTDQAGKLRSTANDGYQQASDKVSQGYQQATDKVSQIVERGKDAYERARGTVGSTSTALRPKSRTPPIRPPRRSRMRRTPPRRSLVRVPRRFRLHRTAAEPPRGRRRGACPAVAPSAEPFMTADRAEKIANVLLTAAGVGAAVYVLKTPSLRRLAWRAAVTAVTGTLPVWFAQEVKQRLERQRPPHAMIGGVTATAERANAASRGRRAILRAKAEVSARRARDLPRRHRDLQQQRPHLRLLDCLLRPPFSFSLFPPHFLDHRYLHQQRARTAPA